jgi:hypothetical protein
MRCDQFRVSPLALLVSKMANIKQDFIAFNNYNNTSVKSEVQIGIIVL